MSTNGGENWYHIDSALKTIDRYVSVVSILLDEKSLGRIYVGLRAHGQPLTPNFSNGGLFLTENNGKSWRKVYDGVVNLIKADNSIPRNIYFVTKFGIMRLIDTLSVTSINDYKADIPLDYNLYQNYPNPFNPVSVISYQLPVSSRVTLKVYDILGSEIKTLLDEFKTAGIYSIDFNASGLSSGVYFYQLRTESFTSTKKMVLVQ
ncbi:MAG: T9SS type A sorting domain-containing protein [Bacteroidetes bacterium]|nr:T9SS type A sorting domain-containing protein [Bacteroidota bacterium]